MGAVILKWIPIYIKRYGTGRMDKDGIRDFVTCEDGNAVRMLLNEFAMVSQGRVADEVLDKLVGPKRKIQFGSYQEWAKNMLSWQAAAKRQG